MASNITTLVEKAKQGDTDAFSTLYQKNRNKNYFFRKI